MLTITAMRTESTHVEHARGSYLISDLPPMSTESYYWKTHLFTSSQLLKTL